MAINFLKYRPGTRLRIPLKFINSDQSVDIRRGCLLVRVNRFIDCKCQNDIPPHIIVDLSQAKQNDVIRLRDIKLPKGVIPTVKFSPPDYVLGIITAGK